MTAVFWQRQAREGLAGCCWPAQSSGAAPPRSSGRAQAPRSSPGDWGWQFSEKGAGRQMAKAKKCLVPGQQCAIEKNTAIMSQKIDSAWLDNTIKSSRFTTFVFYRGTW